MGGAKTAPRGSTAGSLHSWGTAWACDSVLSTLQAESAYLGPESSCLGFRAASSKVYNTSDVYTRTMEIGCLTLGESDLRDTRWGAVNYSVGSGGQS